MKRWTGPIVGALLVLLLGPGGALASGKSASATATTTANVLNGVSLVVTGNLSFGDLVSGSVAGNVTVPVPTAPIPNGPIVLTQGRQATFTILGPANRHYTLTTTAAPLTLNGSNGGTMSVTSLTVTPVPSPKIGSNGQVNVTIGARLRVGANQTPGTYRGTININVTVP